MTLILSRTSCCYAVVVADRRVTRGNAVFDPYANKNLVFHARNAVVAMGYTGIAHIGGIPTDQWIAQTLTTSVFPEGYHGRGTVPAVMSIRYEKDYLGVHVKKLQERLGCVRGTLPLQDRQHWTSTPFDLLVTGFECNHGKIRPYLAALSKPSDSDTFSLNFAGRYWFIPRGQRIPVRTCAVPGQNLTRADIESIHNRLDSVWGDGHGSYQDVANHADAMLAELTQDVSARLNLVGPDTLSILIPHQAIDLTIRIHYNPVESNSGLLVTRESQIPVTVAFSPWIITSGCVLSPSVLTNLNIEPVCGPYRVVIEAPLSDGMPRAMSSQWRPPIDGRR